MDNQFDEYFLGNQNNKTVKQFISTKSHNMINLKLCLRFFSISYFQFFLLYGDM